MKESQQPEVNIGVIGQIDHGKTTLLQALTGVWVSRHSEELKRGITIRLGYADINVKKCPKCKIPDAYTNFDKCMICGSNTVLKRRISFVDAPGHETLMATMLSGAAIMDGAVLVIAANEPCPQPQTKEHLMALEIVGVKNIIIIQNKVDLVSEGEARKHYDQIKAFTKGTIAENSPVIPLSAHHRANIDVLIESIEELIPTPKRELSKPFIFLIARSFDVNKPGAVPSELTGGVLGGALKQGTINTDDEVLILPGRREKKGDALKFNPLKTRVVDLFSGSTKINKAVPGGNIGVKSLLDPFLTKSDQLSGNVVTPVKSPIPVLEELELDVILMKRVVGTRQELDVSPLKQGEDLMINAWTAKTLGTVINPGKPSKVKLKIPVCISKGERIAISRMIGNRWRLIGFAVVK